MKKREFNSEYHRKYESGESREGFAASEMGRKVGESHQPRGFPPKNPSNLPRRGEVSHAAGIGGDMTMYVDGAWERFTALAGGTAYREPLQGGGSSQGGIPNVHELSAAIAMARQGDDDLGPDILFDLVTQSFRHRERVITRLTDAVCSQLGLNRHEVVIEAMTDSYFRVVLGDDQTKTAINPALATLSDVGVAVLTERAGITARRARRCLQD